MKMSRRLVVSFAGSVTAIVGTIGFAGASWAEPYVSLPFAILTVAAVLVAAYAQPCEAAEEHGTLVPSFVLEFAALLLFGAIPSTTIVVVGIVIGLLAGADIVRATRRSLAHASGRMFARIAAIQAAAAAYAALAASAGPLDWPARGALVAAALASYCLVKVVFVPLIVRLVSRQSVDVTWLKAMAAEWPNYVCAAGVSVGVAELLSHQMWQIVPVAAVPLFFAYRGYCHHLARVEEGHRHHTGAHSGEVGLCVVGADGCVTFWNEAIVRLIACPRESAIGRPLATTLSGVRSANIPETLNLVLADGKQRVLSSVAMPSALGGRFVDIGFARRPDGVMLTWQDVSDRAQAERQRDRLTLAAEGAHDALWEWDLRTQELFVSPRWKAMLGASAPSGLCSPDDWLHRVHPEDLPALTAALKSGGDRGVEAFACEHRLRHEDGNYRWFLCRGIAGGPGRKPSRLAGSLTDITERVAVRAAGFLDPLTGLRNRSDFEMAVGRRIQQFRDRPGDGKFAVLYLDLDRFKIVNDSLGHLVGDELLTAVARRLESCLREGDVLARLGGDEFAILLAAIEDGGQANALAFRIRETFSTPVPIAGRDVFTSTSIGIAFGQPEYAAPDEIMRDADTAMYHAKTLGRARHEVFDADMHTRARDRLGMENDLRRAVDYDDFEVHYQPIVLLRTRKCVGFESLVRWKRNGEMVSPAIFVPMAEELGLIDKLGTWILHRACQTFADWQRRFPDAGLEYITVNASGRQLTQPSFVVEVEKAVRDSGLAPSSVRIEITETALMDNPRHAVEMLTRLRESGVKIYLDDFGTGYSSLSHLHRLPVDALKIDQSFVRSMLVPDRPAIVESILALARTMKTGVVAEGIEDDRQAQELIRLGCTHAQGYLFSKPLPAQAAEDVIAANRPLGPASARHHWTESAAVVTPFVATPR
jgi:diguanylate cyclase (GGDEF)-like protein